MAQHIGLRREGERGEVLAHYAREGIPLEVLEMTPRDSACVRFIDPCGDTVFNQLQLPVLIGEFEQMGSANAQVRDRLEPVVAFLAASQGIHQYVRFVGD